MNMCLQSRSNKYISENMWKYRLAYRACDVYNIGWSDETLEPLIYTRFIPGLQGISDKLWLRMCSCRLHSKGSCGQKGWQLRVLGTTYLSKKTDRPIHLATSDNMTWHNTHTCMHMHTYRKWENERWLHLLSPHGRACDYVANSNHCTKSLPAK